MKYKKHIVGFVAVAMTLATAAYACDVVARKPVATGENTNCTQQQTAQVSASFQYNGDDLDEVLARQAQMKAKVERAARDAGASVKLMNENMNISTDYQDGARYNASGSFSYVVSPTEKVVAAFRKLNEAGVRGSMNTNMYSNCGAE